MAESPESYAQELAYDLRIFYAKIVGFKLIEIDEARSKRDYQTYYKKLIELHVIIKHKFKKKADKETDELEYQRLLGIVNRMANEYRNVYLAKSKEEVGVYRLEMALYELEMFLWKAMDGANMFGNKWEDDGL